MFEDVFKPCLHTCLNNSYTIFVDMFIQFLNTCLHHVGKYIYTMNEYLNFLRLVCIYEDICLHDFSLNYLNTYLYNVQTMFEDMFTPI